MKKRKGKALSRLPIMAAALRPRPASPPNSRFRRSAQPAENDLPHRRQVSDARARRAQEFPPCARKRPSTPSSTDAYPNPPPLDWPKPGFHLKEPPLSLAPAHVNERTFPSLCVCVCLCGVFFFRSLGALPPPPPPPSYHPVMRIFQTVTRRVSLL